LISRRGAWEESARKKELRHKVVWVYSLKPDAAQRLRGNHDTAEARTARGCHEEFDFCGAGGTNDTVRVLAERTSKVIERGHPGKRTFVANAETRKIIMRSF